MRITVLASPGASTEILLNYLQDAGFTEVSAIFEEPTSRAAMLRFRRRKLGLWAVLGQVAFMGLVSPVLLRRGGARRAALLQEYGLRDSPADGVRRVAVANANSADAIAALQASAPDVVLVNGTRILRKGILGAVSVPFINTHVGITPMYRGVHGGYWALAQGDAKNFGTTLHLVDEGVDTGAILAQVRATPVAQDNFATYPLLQQAVSLPVLAEMLRVFPDAGLPRVQEADGPSRQWYHPTIMQYLLYRLQGVR